MTGWLELLSASMSDLSFRTMIKAILFIINLNDANNWEILEAPLWPGFWGYEFILQEEFGSLNETISSMSWMLETWRRVEGVRVIRGLIPLPFLKFQLSIQQRISFYWVGDAYFKSHMTIRIRNDIYINHWFTEIPLLTISNFDSLTKP